MVMPLMTDAERTALALEGLARIEAADKAREDKWDAFYLGMADYVASASKDPSTKVGCVIVRPDLTVASVGFNGFARNMRDDPELYENRDEKYSRIIHAEMNAILNAHGLVDECTLYITLAPCDRCAVMIAQAGIHRVVAVQPTEEQAERWADALAKAEGYLMEAGIIFKTMELP